MGTMASSHETSPFTSIYVSPYVNDIIYLHLMAEASDTSSTLSTPSLLDKVDRYPSLEWCTFQELPDNFLRCRNLPRNQQQQFSLPHVINHPYAARWQLSTLCGGCLTPIHPEDPFLYTVAFKHDLTGPALFCSLSALSAEEITHCLFDSPDICFPLDLPELLNKDIVFYFNEVKGVPNKYSLLLPWTTKSPLSPNMINLQVRWIIVHQTHQLFTSYHLMLGKPILPHLAIGEPDSRLFPGNVALIPSNPMSSP